MKAARNLVLGTAAGLMTLGGAQAADLPVKAKAVEYVRICSAYGAGFFFIPGTDTCIKFSGYVRADVTFNGGGAHGQPAWNGDAGEQNRYRDYFVDRSRMFLAVDTRTATEYGVVRTFGAAKFQFTTLGGSTFNPNSINTSLPVANSNLLDTAGGGYVAVTDLFLQFAGFTFGKSASAMQTPGRVRRATSRRFCWAASRPTTPVPTTSSTRWNWAMASPPRSALTIRPFGTAPPSTICRCR
jgi:Porin subfamily